MAAQCVAGDMAHTLGFEQVAMMVFSAIPHSVDKLQSTHTEKGMEKFLNLKTMQGARKGSRKYSVGESWRP